MSIPTNLPPMTLLFGTNEAKQTVFYPLSNLPHLLVCGVSGCGRSNLLRTEVAVLASNTDCSHLEFILIDFKSVEFSQFSNIPHLLAPPLTDAVHASAALNAVSSEVYRRLKVFQSAAVRNISEYNKSAEKSLPNIVVVIDELQDILTSDSTSIYTILQSGRTVGIHILAASQRALPKELLTCFPSKISFRIASKKMAFSIGMPGAENLPLDGTALFSPIDYGDPVKVRIDELSDSDVSNCVSAITTPAGNLPDKEHFSQPIDKNPVQYLHSDEFCCDTTYEGDNNSCHDPLFECAKQVVIENGFATTSLLQRKLKLGYARAAHLIDCLEQEKVIGPYNGTTPRTILAPYSTPKDVLVPSSPISQTQEIDSILAYLVSSDCTAKPDDVSDPSPQRTQEATSEFSAQDDFPAIITPLLAITQKTKSVFGNIKRKSSSFSRTYRPTLDKCDYMEGHDFERLCADVLRTNGYTGVRVTPASGDYGVDVLASKNGTQYAIQCKCYSAPVGNHAVQEAFAGASYYGGGIPVVLTNQYFTPAAQKQAKAIGVLLWDRDKLKKLLEAYDSPARRILRVVFKIISVLLKIAFYLVVAIAAIIICGIYFAFCAAFFLVFPSFRKRVLRRKK